MQEKGRTISDIWHLEAGEVTCNAGGMHCWRLPALETDISENESEEHRPDFIEKVLNLLFKILAIADGAWKRFCQTASSLI